MTLSSRLRTQLHIQVIVESDGVPLDKLIPYQQYVQFLCNRRKLSKIEAASQGYEDVLQAPLQVQRCDDEFIQS